MTQDHLDNGENDFDGPSKSAIKREMTALQTLGERLVELPAARLAQIPISDEALLEAIALAQRITARGGLRRQLQYIGKLMRRIDAEPIEQALNALDHQDSAEKARFHRLENLRDHFLDEGDTALDAVLSAFPNADRQQLRQLYRQHKQDKNAGKPPTAGRKLFRYLRQLDEAANNSD